MTKRRAIHCRMGFAGQTVSTASIGQMRRSLSLARERLGTSCMLWGLYQAILLITIPMPSIYSRICTTTTGTRLQCNMLGATWSILWKPTGKSISGRATRGICWKASRDTTIIRSWVCLNVNAISWLKPLADHFKDGQRQEAYNLFLGNYIFAQGQPMLWDLSTDYYLHHADPRLGKRRRR